MTKSKIGLTTVRGTPVYVVPSFSGDLGRAYGGKFHQPSGYWVYPAFYPFHKQPIDDLKKLFPGLTVSDLVQNHLDQQEGYYKNIEDCKLDDGFNWVTTPDDYQRETIAHLVYTLRSGALLDCGLGKTKCIIDTVRYLNWNAKQKGNRTLGMATHKTLCLVKASVLWNWPEEIIKHSEPDEFTTGVIDGSTSKKKLQSVEDQAESDFLIVTYEQAAQPGFADVILKNFAYNVIVADESHKMQTWKSRNTQAAVKLSARAYRRIIASGTATLGDPRHLYGQLSFLASFLPGGSYYQYCERYLSKAPYNNKIVIGYKNLGTINKALHRVSKVVKIDGKISTTRTVHTVPVALSGAQRDKYTEVVELENTARPDTGDQAWFKEPIVRLAKAQQICGGFMNFSNEDASICDTCEHLEFCMDQGIKPYTSRCLVEPARKKPTVWHCPDNPKLAAMMDKLDEVLIDPSNAVIITHRFITEQEYIKTELAKRDIRYICIDSGTSPKEQQRRAASFEKDADVRVYLAQISTLVGINLVRAKYIFFYSLSFDLKDYEQARGRNYRRTQKAPEVFEYLFYAENTVESAIMEALATKTEIKDLILTRVDCTTCPEGVDKCIKAGIRPWKSGCILDNTKTRSVIKLA